MRCEETDQGYWGVYFTPKEKQREVDGIFSMLYFERVIVPGAAGTPEKIIVNFESNIKILDEQLAETDRQIRAIWEEEKSAISLRVQSGSEAGGSLCASSVCSLQRQNFCLCRLDTCR